MWHNCQMRNDPFKDNMMLTRVERYKHEIQTYKIKSKTNWQCHDEETENDQNSKNNA